MSQIAREISGKLHFTKDMHPIHNVFDGYPYNPNNVNKFGWNSEYPIFEELISQFKPKIIIETGVLLGKCVIHLAKLQKKYGIEGCVIANDTWRGCHHLQAIRSTIPLLDMKFGEPTYYHTFVNNIISEDLQDVVIPYIMDTRSCMRGLLEKGIRVDLIHHDASHKSPDVYYDLLEIEKILNPGAWVVIDDYSKSNLPDTDSQGFNGLCMDVERFCEERGYKINGIGKAWFQVK